MLTDPALARSCGARGLVRAREFSWERSVARTRELVQRGRSETTLRVALVHDWLTGMRGGEKVLEALCELYPDADIFTLFHDRGSVSPAIERHRIETSFVQRLPFARSHYRSYLPLFPIAIEQFDLDAYDLVISSSHCAAKAVVAPGRARHLCYCHSPMRYAWDQFDAYFGPARVGRGGEPLALPPAAGAAGALGRGHRGARGPLRRQLAPRCGPDPPIL